MQFWPDGPLVPIDVSTSGYTCNTLRRASPSEAIPSSFAGRVIVLEMVLWPNGSGTASDIVWLVLGQTDGGCFQRIGLLNLQRKAELKDEWKKASEEMEVTIV